MTTGHAFHRFDTNTSADAAEILLGLTSTPKRLPCRLLYDEFGSQLFERICETPEYYPTRTELGILNEHAAEMLEETGPEATLVEWGSGASVKTRLLLRALKLPRLYVPIDISEAILIASCRAIERDFPSLEVRPMVADYLKPLSLPLRADERERPLVTFFPGSTLGNFEPDAAVEFLSRVRATGGRRQSFILGTDLPKTPTVLEAAYDDAAGITAQFNLNVLEVVNRTFGAHFDRSEFRHEAVYNAAQRRIEMHLVSRRRQVVQMLGVSVRLEEGEPIVTEHCYKYGLEELADMAARAGFNPTRVWTDRDQRFAVYLWRPS